MPAQYLHGVETIEIPNGSSPINVVKSAVIAIAGIAPLGPRQALTLVSNPTDAAQFGALLPGFNIPFALDAIYKQGNVGTCVVVNVYDPTLHNVSESAESHTPVNNKAKLDYAPLDNLVVTNGSGHTYTLGTDYEVDVYGNIKLKGAAVLGIPEVLATGSLTVTGGTNSPGVNKISAVRVNGVDILGAAVDFQPGSIVFTAQAIAAQITSFTSSPEYAVNVIGATIHITALPGTGATPNGFIVTATLAGDVTATYVNMAGGATAVAPATVIEADYDRLDETAVVAADILGTYTANAMTWTGMRMWELTYSTYGFTPKLLIAPGYSTLAGVAAQLTVNALAYRAMAFIDAPIGTTTQDAVAGRGPAGTINFNTDDKRVILCYPHLKVFHADSNADVLQPYSQFLAGVIAATDLAVGYWRSPSMRDIKGITGVEVLYPSSINDASTAGNTLNSVGIVNYFNGPGTGFKVFGNSSASFPTNTNPDHFICVRRTSDVINESIELAMIPFLDAPISASQIDSIKQTVNNFLNSLIQRGGLIDGICTFNPNLNPPNQLAAGQIVFSVSYMPPTPSERITFNTTIDINMLRNLLVA